MCKTKHCRKPIVTGGLCHSCRIKRYKKLYPEKYAFQVLRNNAKRRGHEFTISVAYFLRFVKKNDYMARKGITKTSYHIDRIKEHLGYIPGNIQVLTNKDNVAKYLSWSHDKDGKPDNFKFKQKIKLDAKEYPF